MEFQVPFRGKMWKCEKKKIDGVKALEEDIQYIYSRMRLAILALLVLSMRLPCVGALCFFPYVVGDIRQDIKQ